MRLQLTIGKDLYQVQIDPSGDGYDVVVNGKPFRAVPAPGGFSIGGTTHRVEILAQESGTVRASVDGKTLEALILDVAKAVPKPSGSAPAPSAPAAVSASDVVAPMPGKIVRVIAVAGAAVKAGTPLLVLEAMKMQNEIPAPFDGVVREVCVKEGDAVGANDLLVRMDRRSGDKP